MSVWQKGFGHATTEALYKLLVGLTQLEKWFAVVGDRARVPTGRILGFESNVVVHSIVVLLGLDNRNKPGTPSIRIVLGARFWQRWLLGGLEISFPVMLQKLLSELNAQAPVD